MFSQTPFEQIPLVREHSSISENKSIFKLIEHMKFESILCTFARASVGSQFVTGWTFAAEATGSVDTFATATQSGSALALVNILRKVTSFIL